MPTRSTQHGLHTSSVVPMPSDSGVTNPVRSRAAGRLEPCAGKLACTVLRGGHAGNGVSLPDGKDRTPYEFGVKTSVAVTAKEGLVVGMRSMPGNPYDGHTVDSQIEQIGILTGITPKMALVDRGYRGVQASAGTRLLVSHTRRLPKNLKKLLKRRQVVEPMIGHMKSDGLLGRNWLKGALGDAMFVVRAAPATT